MQQISDPRPDGPGRRRLPRRPVRIPEGEGADLERYLAEYTDIIDERLEDGLAAIQRTAAKLLRHVAAEVWRASGPQASRNMTESVIGSLAQDDALRALLTHTDERYQALQVRVADMEAVIRQLAEATREAIAGVNERAPGSQQFERQREEMRRFTARLGQALGEMHRQLTSGLRGELQRLESAVTSQATLDREATGAIRGEIAGTVTGLRRDVAAARAELRDGLADARDGLRAEMAELRHGLADEIERALAPTAERLGTVLESLRAGIEGRLREGQDLLERSRRAQQEQLGAFATRATRGLGQVAQRLHGEIASLARRVEEAEQRTGERVDGLRDEVGAFRQRAGAGLAEVGDRIQGGFRLMLANLEAREQQAVDGVEEAIRAEIQRVHGEIVGVAERTGEALEAVRADLTERLGDARGATGKEAVEVVTRIVKKQATRHQETVKGVTRSLRHLLEAVQKSSERQAGVMERVLRATAQRQEAILDETLAALRASLEELGSAGEGEDGGGSRRSLGGRLRTMEQRLGRLSEELTSTVRK